MLPFDFKILRNANVTCFCRLIFSISPVRFRNDHVTCNYNTLGPVSLTVAEVHVALWYFRNGQDSMSSSGFNGPIVAGLKDRHQYAERHLRYLALLSISNQRNII